MTILQEPPQSGTGDAGRDWFKFSQADEAELRHTEAWEHETFAEEQARWERDDPEYARICEQVRQAKDKGGEASLRADKAKAEWDARMARQRQAADDAEKARHALQADYTARPGGALTGPDAAAPTRSPKTGRAVTRLGHRLEGSARRAQGRLRTCDG